MKPEWFADRSLRWRIALFAALCAVTIADLAFPPDMSRVQTLSPEVTDRDGAALRVFLSPDGAWRGKTAPTQVSPQYLQMLTPYEDKRFEQHIGVDGSALLRAAYQFARAGHIVSGG